jgi:hypothetical protein
MMDEIMAKRWDENSPMGGGPICTGESPNQVTRPTLIDACVTTATPTSNLGPNETIPEIRINFDDVDDYNGIDETDNFTDQNGAASNLPGYRRQVAVRYIASTTNTIDQTTDNAGGNTTDTKLVVVTITSPLSEIFRFVAVSCNI